MRTVSSRPTLAKRVLQDGHEVLCVDNFYIVTRSNWRPYVFEAPRGQWHYQLANFLTALLGRITLASTTGVEETSTYFGEAHRRRIRTNNPFEPLLCEIRRRTLVAEAFPTDKAVTARASEGCRSAQDVRKTLDTNGSRVHPRGVYQQEARNM
jgi:hypothetical protein